MKKGKSGPDDADSISNALSSAPKDTQSDNQQGSNEKN